MSFIPFLTRNLWSCMCANTAMNSWFTPALTSTPPPSSAHFLANERRRNCCYMYSPWSKVLVRPKTTTVPFGLNMFGLETACNRDDGLSFFLAVMTRELEHEHEKVCRKVWRWREGFGLVTALKEWSRAYTSVIRYFPPNTKQLDLVKSFK